MAAHKSTAARRYVRRCLVLGLAYVVLIVGAGLLFRHAPPHGVTAWIVAILPALPVIGVVAAVMRLLVEESDEFQRMLHVRQVMIATGFCLAVVTVRDFLHNFDVIPAGDAGFGAVFFWFMGLGLGALWNRVREGAGGGGCCA